MGTWGPGIFSNDTAGDVRDAWREALMDGLDGEAATARVFEQLGAAFDDSPDGIDAWLALAAAQSQTGRLQPAVRDRALEIIDAGGDLESWRDQPASFVRQRKKALAKLAEMLRAPQPAPKTLKRPKFRSSPLDVGDVVHVRNGDTEALFIAVGLIRTGPGVSPVVAELFWEGGDIPDDDALKNMPLVHRDPSGGLDAIVREFTGTRYKGPVPQLWCVDSPSRGRHALKHSGTVIANGIVRSDVSALTRLQSQAYAGYPAMGGGEWDRIAELTTWAWHDRLIETTRKVYGL